MDFAGNRTLLGVTAILLALLAAAIFFYNQALNELAASSCTDISADCPHKKVVETQNAVIAVLLLVIAAVVGWIFLQMRRDETGKIARDASPAIAPKKADATVLDFDEKRVAAIIQEKGGSAFQSDLIRQTGLSKVKMSRLLDRMEQKGILERKRRGMANLVVMK